MSTKQPDIQVQISDVSLQFEADEPPVLHDVHVQIRKKEFVSIIGRSGCGKSSLLQLVGGLLQPTQGEVRIGGKVVTELRTELTYVFQKPVLLEWRTVLENVLLPIEIQRQIKDVDRERARDRLELVGLAEHSHKFPHECSGGMMSRAALARALLVNPQILLMDEPFATLDTLTKEELQIELGAIRQRFEPTVIFITHDIHEAIFLSDRVLVLGGSPACIVQDFAIPFGPSRPPELKFEPEFAEMSKKIHEQLHRLGNDRV